MIVVAKNISDNIISLENRCDCIFIVSITNDDGESGKVFPFDESTKKIAYSKARSYFNEMKEELTRRCFIK